MPYFEEVDGNSYLFSYCKELKQNESHDASRVVLLQPLTNSDFQEYHDEPNLHETG